MSETRVMERQRIADPFGSDFASMGAQQENLPALSARFAGSASDQAMADVITAQKVAIKRDIGGVINTVQKLARAAGQQFYYSIPFKNRKEGRTDWVEGISIKGAMAVATAYGNCKVESLVMQETQSHWIFAARFTDYETGFSLIRTFQQRKGQDTGMKDKDRSLDLVYQIGQSKALRNVIKDALPIYCDHAFMAAKEGILQRVENKPEEARAWILQELNELGVNLRNVERIRGRVARKWTVKDMVLLMSELQQVKDGMSHAEDVWPDPDADDDTVIEGDGEEVKETKPAATKPKAEPKKEPRPKAEPKKEPEPQPEPQDDEGDQDGPEEQQEEAEPRRQQSEDPAAGLDFGS